MTQINTGEKFSLEATPKDEAGFEVDVDATFTSSDETIAPLTPFLNEDGTEDPDKRWVGSGTPGSATITIEVATGGDPATLTVTHAVDIVPAGVATLEVTAGDPVPE